jgi:hypothetical protein
MATRIAIGEPGVIVANTEPASRCKWYNVPTTAGSAAASLSLCEPKQQNH